MFVGNGMECDGIRGAGMPFELGLEAKVGCASVPVNRPEANCGVVRGRREVSPIVSV
jgi:hypothetical protein